MRVTSLVINVLFIILGLVMSNVYENRITLPIIKNIYYLFMVIISLMVVGFAGTEALRSIGLLRIP